MQRHFSKAFLVQGNFPSANFPSGKFLEPLWPFTTNPHPINPYQTYKLYYVQCFIRKTEARNKQVLHCSGFVQIVGETWFYSCTILRCSKTWSFSYLSPFQFSTLKNILSILKSPDLQTPAIHNYHTLN